MSTVVPAARLLMVFGACLATACARSHYAVGRNVQVSLAQSSVQHYETQIAADPERAEHLIACAYTIRSADVMSDNVFYVSFDRGGTWSHTLTVPVSADPSCQIGLRSTAFAASIHDVSSAGWQE